MSYSVNDPYRLNFPNPINEEIVLTNPTQYKEISHKKHNSKKSSAYLTKAQQEEELEKINARNMATRYANIASNSSQLPFGNTYVNRRNKNIKQPIGNAPKSMRNFIYKRNPEDDYVETINTGDSPNAEDLFNDEDSYVIANTTNTDDILFKKQYTNTNPDAKNPKYSTDDNSIFYSNIIRTTQNTDSPNSSSLDNSMDSNEYKSYVKNEIKKREKDAKEQSRAKNIEGMHATWDRIYRSNNKSNKIVPNGGKRKTRKQRKQKTRKVRRTNKSSKTRRNTGK